MGASAYTRKQCRESLKLGKASIKWVYVLLQVEPTETMETIFAYFLKFFPIFLRFFSNSSRFFNFSTRFFFNFSLICTRFQNFLIFSRVLFENFNFHVFRQSMEPIPCTGISYFVLYHLSWCEQFFRFGERIKIQIGAYH